MSDDREDTGQSPRIVQDRPPESVQQTVAAMRGGWAGWQRWTEEDQAMIDARECTDASCMNVQVNCGFQGLDADSHLSQTAAVSSNLRNAWKTKLAGEGKTPGTTTLRDLVFGSDR